MAKLSRREVIGGAAVSGFVVSAATAAETEQPPFGPAPRLGCFDPDALT